MGPLKLFCYLTGLLYLWERRPVLVSHLYLSALEKRALDYEDLLHAFTVYRAENPRPPIIDPNFTRSEEIE